MNKNLLLLSMISVVVTGCSHASTHGTVAMKESDSLAHVSIHNVKEGEKVILYHNRCSGGKESNKGCVREKDADGVIRKVFNEHYSLVEFPSGTSFKEGDYVETP